MEIELNDLKSKIDSDIMETRALEEQASAIPRLEVTLLSPLDLFAGKSCQASFHIHAMHRHGNSGLKPCVATRRHKRPSRPMCSKR